MCHLSMFINATERRLAEYNEPLPEFIKTRPHRNGDSTEKDEKVIFVRHTKEGVNLACLME